MVSRFTIAGHVSTWKFPEENNGFVKQSQRLEIYLDTIPSIRNLRILENSRVRENWKKEEKVNKARSGSNTC